MSYLTMIFCIIFWEVFLTNTEKRNKTCSKYSGEFDVTFSGYKLSNTTSLIIRNVNEVFTCAMLCIQHDVCKTYSVSLVQKICLLHKKAVGEDGADLEKDELWTYYEQSTGVKVGKLCESNKASVGNTCLKRSGNKGYMSTCGRNTDKLKEFLPTDPLPISCKHLKDSSKKKVFSSGYYWINVNDTRVKVFCDMETDRGGWTLISNVVTTNSSYPDLLTFINDDPTQITKAISENFALTANGLIELEKLIGFQQVRFYCHKPSVNRTIDIMTNLNNTGNAVVDYFTLKTTVKPDACGSYSLLPDDDSLLSRDCRRWSRREWNAVDPLDYGGYQIKILVFPFYSTIAQHYSLGGSMNSFRYECDDFLSIHKGGVWKYFIR